MKVKTKGFTSIQKFANVYCDYYGIPYAYFDKCFIIGNNETGCRIYYDDCSVEPELWSPEMVISRIKNSVNIENGKFVGVKDPEMALDEALFYLENTSANKK